MKTLNLSYDKKYLYKQFKVILLSLVSIVISAIIPLLLKNIIDRFNFYLKNNLNNILYYQLIILILLTTFKKLFDFLFNYNFNNLFYIVSTDYRKNILINILNSSYLRLKKQNSSTILNRVLNEVEGYGDIYGLFIPMLIINILILIASTIVLIKLNYILFLISLIFTPCILFISNFFKKELREKSQKSRIAYENLQKNLLDILNGFIDIKIFKSQRKFINIFSKYNNELLRKNISLNFSSRKASDIMDFLFSSFPFIILAIGLFLITKNITTMGSVIAFFIYIGYFIEPFINLSELRLRIIQGKSKVELIEKLLDELKNKEKKSNSLQLNEPIKKITIEKIDFSYDEHFVFKLDKKLVFNKEKRVIGVVGETGCGKSTFLKIISKLLENDINSIYFNNININKIELDSFYDKVSYFSNENHIFNGSIYDNITLFSNYDIEEQEKIIIEDFLKDLKNKIKNVTIISENAKDISLGQKQRIILSRVFAKGKKQQIIILDEILSGVDSNMESQILNKIKKYFEDSFIFICSHRLSTIKNTDLVIYLNKENQIEIMETSMILNNKKFNDLFLNQK